MSKVQKRPPPPKLALLRDAVSDVRFDTVQDCVDSLNQRMREGFERNLKGTEFKPSSIVIVVLDEHGVQYNMRLYTSNMMNTDIVKVLAIAQHKEIHTLLTGG